METQKITEHQLMALTANGAVGGSLIITSAIMAKVARQDAWLSALAAPAVGIMVLWIYVKLGTRHPDMTLVGMTKTIFGKWAGLPVAGLYVFFFFLGACRLPWYVGDFAGHILHETPITIINLVFITAVVAALWYGIETTARSAELFLWFIIVLFILAMVLVAPQSEIDYLMPVLEFGPVPVLKGAVLLSSYVVLPLITLMMVYPKHTPPGKKAARAVYKGFLWASAIDFTAITFTILVLGHIITSEQQYPTYSLAKEIDVGGIFSRLEYLISVIWMMTQFTIATLYSHAAVEGLSELLGLKDTKKILLPLGLLILALSEVVFPDTVYQSNWSKQTWIPFSMTFAVILPCALLLVDVIKEKVGKSKEN